jgi:hypothetical protein
MKETLESALGFFPSDAQAAVVLEPGDRAFYGPKPAVSAQGSTVLGLGAVGTVGRDHFDAMGGQFGIQGITVISLVAKDSRGLLPGEHEAEEFLDQTDFVRRAADRHRGRPPHHSPHRHALGQAGWHVHIVAESKRDFYGGKLHHRHHIENSI